VYVLGTVDFICIKQLSLHMQEKRILLLSRCTITMHIPKDNASSESDAYAKGMHMHQL
jgi:hypothetical protein